MRIDHAPDEGGRHGQHGSEANGLGRPLTAAKRRPLARRLRELMSGWSKLCRKGKGQKAKTETTEARTFLTIKIWAAISISALARY